MRRPAFLFAFAGALVLAHVAMRAGGLAEHTSVIAGMPLSASSWALGPLYVAVYLAAATAAPVLALAASPEALLVLREDAARSAGLAGERRPAERRLEGPAADGHVQ